MPIKWLSKPKGGLIASLLRSRLSNDDALAAIGLTPKEEGYQAARGLPAVTWPHHKKETKVKLVIPAGTEKQIAWRYLATAGMTGTVLGLAQGQGKDNYPEEDLYQVLLDEPLKSGRNIVYAYYQELEELK